MYTVRNNDNYWSTLLLKSGLGILGTFFGVFYCTPASAEVNDPPKTIAFLKQDIPQYNTVFKSAKEYLAKQRGKFRIDAFDISSNHTLEELKKNSSEYDLVASIGTKSFVTALHHFPSKLHTFGMLMSIDSEQIKNSSAKNGKNICGVSLLAKPQAYLDYVNQVHEDVHKIGILYSSREFDSYLSDFEAEAKKFGIAIVAAKISKKKEFVKKFKSVLKSDINTFLILPDFSLYEPKSLEHVLVETYNRRIPCIGPSESFVKSGALWAFRLDLNKVGEQMGKLIADHVPSNELTIRYYSPSSICINMIVAENLEIKIPYRVRKDAFLIEKENK